MTRKPRWLGLVSQKGGSGKSTLTVHLAVAAMQAGERVVILDADPQGSALAWGAAREADDELRVERLADGATEKQIAAKVGDATLVLVDFPPRATGSVSRIAGRLDYALVPIGPSAFDVATIGATAHLLRAKSVGFSVVLNRTPPPRVLEVAGAQAALAEMDVAVAPLSIGDRRPFVRALESGLAAIEFDPGGKAAAEITSLWKFAQGHLR